MQLHVDLLRQIVESTACVPMAGPDLRQHARTQLIGHAMVIPCPARVERKPIAAVVTDLSASGIGVVLPVHLRPGEQFIVRLPASSATSARAVLCTVVQARYAGGGFATGATFARVLGPNGDPAACETVPPLLHAQQVSNAFREDTFSQLTEEGREHLRELEQRLGRMN